MKEQFGEIYSQLERCSHLPNQYYGHLITLSGMVYKADADAAAIEKDLKQLSLAYESLHNSTLAKIKEIVHEIVFWTKNERNNRLPDIDHILHQHRNATIDQVNALLANAAQLTNEGNVVNDRQERIVADFTPLVRQLEQLMKDAKPIETHDLNLPKIIGWLTQKAFDLGYLDSDTKSSEGDE